MCYAVASLIITGFQAYQQKRAGDREAAIEEMNARVEDRAKATARQDAQNAANLIRAQGARDIGEQVAIFASSGVDVGSGTPLDVLAGSAEAVELDARTALVQGERDAYGHRIAALNYRMRAAAAARGGRAQAASTILSSARNVYGGYLSYTS